jgi:hypothetical protein
MVTINLFRDTVDLYKLAELQELILALYKVNLLPLSILSMIKEYWLMDKESVDKLSPSEDYISPTMYSKLAEE